MALNHQDQEVIGQLRRKYSSNCAVVAEATPDLQRESWGANQGAWRQPASLAEARLCHRCQGSGVQTQLYEYRRLENTCSDCHGEGVFVSGADDVPHKPQRVSSDANNSCMEDNLGLGSQQQHQSCDTGAAAAAAVPQDAGLDCCRAATLLSQTSLQRTLSRDQRQLRKLEEKIDELQQERTDLLAKIASSRSVEEKVLQKNLLEHITLHVEHLQSVYREKQAACGGGC